MTHFVCMGGCNGVSETAGTCNAESCASYGHELTACDCAGGPEAHTHTD